MIVDSLYLPAFRESLDLLGRATGNLRFTLERVSRFLPLDAATVQALAPEALERLDALEIRFARCQQMAGQAFKALALLESEPQSRFIDLLALMQKRGLIESIATWDAQRDLRNDIGHVYLPNHADFARFHNALAEAAPGVAAYAGRLAAYAAKVGACGLSA